MEYPYFFASLVVSSTFNENFYRKVPHFNLYSSFVFHHCGVLQANKVITLFARELLMLAIIEGWMNTFAYHISTLLLIAWSSWTKFHPSMTCM